MPAPRRRLAALALLTACGGSSLPPIPPAAVPNPPGPSAPALTSTTQAPPQVQEPGGTAGALQHAVLGTRGAADIVASLTTEVGARLAGSPGDRLAVAWAVAKMRALGLTNVHTEPVRVPVWQRGVETAALVAPYPHALAVTALGWSGATPAKGVTGDLVRFDSLDALKAAPEKSLAGKIAFLDVRMYDAPEKPGYGTAVAARRAGPSEAATKGALALVIRSIGSDDMRFPHTGTMKREKDAAHALPAGALSNADADLVERVLAAHGDRARLTLNLGPRWLPDAESANVVGEVPGRELPGDVVLMGAHLDSWDLGEGALDDGAGCGIVLEAARALSALPTKPRRTVRVVLFAAEENSLAGGTGYAKAHASEAPHVVGAMEADSGTGKVVQAMVLTADDARQHFLSIGRLLAPLGVTMLADKGHGGSDISPLRELGVPQIDLRQDDARYFRTHHTANDTFARIDPAALSQAAATFATTAWAVADMPDDLGRIPQAERAEAGW